LGVVAAKAITPIVELMFTHERFIADCTTGREVVFVTVLVARLCSVHIEAGIGDGLVTDGAAKMFRVPVSV